MPNIGMQEIIILGVIVLIIFGPRQLPKLGRSIGETIREFRGVRREIEQAHEENDNAR